MVSMGMKEQGFSQAGTGGIWHSGEQACSSTVKACSSNVKEIKYQYLPTGSQVSHFYSKPPPKLHSCILKVEFCTGKCQVVLRTFPWLSLAGPAVAWFVFSILGGGMEMANSRLQKIIHEAAAFAGCYWAVHIVVPHAIKRKWNNETRQSHSGTQCLATHLRTRAAALRAGVYILAQIKNTVGFLDNKTAKGCMLNKGAAVSLLLCCAIVWPRGPWPPYYFHQWSRENQNLPPQRHNSSSCLTEALVRSNCAGATGILANAWP